MSSLTVPVAEIQNIHQHPNADTLDIAEVLGWQVVIPRGQYHQGEKVVYFPPDTVLPVEVSDRFEVTRYLRKQRIQSTRLRGEPSFGLVVPIENEGWTIGQDVAEHYGAIKWEPPARDRGNHPIPNEHQVPRNPFFPEYADIENLRHYPNLFLDDEMVVISEKIHGTNSRIGMIDGEWVAGSHRVQRGPGDELYWGPREQAEWMVSVLGKVHKQVLLFGEIYGSAVQSLDYGIPGHRGYRAFDLMIDGRYLDWHSFQIICQLYHVSTVPTLYIGLFNLETVRELSKGQTTLGADHLREGVVVRPLLERTHPKVGRLVLKYVSDDYLLAKKTDFREE